PVAGLLQVSDLAAAAIGDAGLGDLVVFDRVARAHVLRADDALHRELAQLVVDAYLLLTGDHEVPVRQLIRDDRGDLQLDLLLAVDLAVAGAGTVAGEVDELTRIIAVRHDLGCRRLEAEQVRHARCFRPVAGARRVVLELGALVDVDDDGEDVADLRSALVLEEGRGARLPQRGVLADGGRVRRRRQGARRVVRVFAWILHRAHRGRLAEMVELVANTAAQAGGKSGQG